MIGIIPSCTKIITPFFLFDGSHSNTLFENLKRTEPKFIKQYFKKIPIVDSDGSYDVIGFNQNQLKKELKKYLYQISKNPVLKESHSSLDISKDDFIDFSELSLELYVSNEILIQVYEKYFKLISGRVGGAYTWAYFKQPLTLNFIKNKVLVEENCRGQLCQEHLWCNY